MFEEDVLVVLEALLVDLEVVEEVDQLSCVCVQIPKRVDEYDFVAGHWDAVLYVSWELFVGDHEDDDLEAL